MPATLGIFANKTLDPGCEMLWSDGSFAISHGLARLIAATNRYKRAERLTGAGLVIKGSEVTNEF
jgi:hypothetical protein